MASILHNPQQVIDHGLLKTLNKEVDKTGYTLKPLSRAVNYQSHSVGGSVNFLNFKLLEAHKKAVIESEKEKKHEELARVERRIKNTRLPDIS